jgi:hypothetical protein
VDAEPKSYNQTGERKLAAIANLNRHPELDLLFESKGARVKDHFLRDIKGCTYRLFLRAGDVWALREAHKFIEKIEDAEMRASCEAQAKAAFHEQFLHYKEVHQGTWPPPKDMPEEALYDERNKTQMREVIEKLKSSFRK